MKKSEITKITEESLSNPKILFKVNDNKLVINTNHIFFLALYERTSILQNAHIYAEEEPDSITRACEEIELLMDILFMGYAKAENMFHNPDELFSELKKIWGEKTEGYLSELLNAQQY